MCAKILGYLVSSFVELASISLILSSCSCFYFFFQKTDEHASITFWLPIDYLQSYDIIDCFMREILEIITYIILISIMIIYSLNIV